MSRTDFEAAYIERYGHRPRGWNDDFQVYQDAHANGAWFGWQAGAAGIEAKAAPVGELREAFEAWCEESWQYVKSPVVFEAFQAGAAYQRAQQPQSAVAVGEVKLQHMAIAEDGCLRWMTGRKIDSCYLYAMPDFGRAPKLYTTPQPSAGVVMPERLRAALAMVLKALDRDAADGREVRGEMASELRSAMDEFARLNGKEVGRG